MATRRGVDDVLQAAVEAGDVPCVVAMAGDRDGVIYEGAAGERMPGSGEMVGADTTFRIASMTKMVATVAALQLVERGQLDLDDAIETYLPEFGELQVLEGFDGDTPRLRPPASRATVRQLITHTTGLAYWFFNADIVRWEELTGTPNVMSGSNAIFTAPLVADPGAKYEYGINIDWLGRVVEAVGGQSLDAYFAEHILGPLGMGSTTFLMNDEQRANVVPIHIRGEDGSWTATDVDWSQEPEWWAGGHGLYSTPRDYLKFQRMLLGGGTLGDAKILERSTVQEAFTNQIGELDFPPAIATADPPVTGDFNGGPGLKWGFGLLLNTQQVPGMRAAGSGAWAGLFNTHFWVDPTTGVTGAIYTQSLPFVEPRVFQVYVDFEQALYASLAEPSAKRSRFTRESAPAEQGEVRT
jgi:methyl acetate hydrolase